MRRVERKQGYYHGLLQTPDYAHARISAIDSGHSEEWVAGVVNTRMERRRILARPNAARFNFYIHENALRLRVGSDELHVGGGGLAVEPRSVEVGQLCAAVREVEVDEGCGGQVDLDTVPECGFRWCGESAGSPKRWGRRRLVRMTSTIVCR
ncbi:Scr1 family TA system antitoxin-like transcriptional regulator [Actinophytocola sp.]|uniref:Scr1 family TA system antitoxin-like transcriptional regulator n=1 Tax=Actinophytocola sp. TaxID=1872138 RepID=UPI00389AB9D0